MSGKGRKITSKNGTVFIIWADDKKETLTLGFVENIDTVRFEEWLYEEGMDKFDEWYKREHKHTNHKNILKGSNSVICKFCEESYDVNLMHLHDHGYVCENCWDERLRATE